MAHSHTQTPAKIVFNNDHASGLRTIGGLLGQLEVAELDRDVSVRILSSVGLPEQAYDDPSFPVSARQDFEVLNEIRKHMRLEYSMEVSLFGMIPMMRSEMFGALGMAWQSAPSFLEVVKISNSYPQLNWGRTQVVMSASDQAVFIDHELKRIPAPLSTPEDVEATYKYALLLDITGTIAIIMDTIPDKGLLRAIKLPFAEPDDWRGIKDRLPWQVVFGSERAQIELKPEFLTTAPRKANPFSFRLAMQLVDSQSAALTEQDSVRDTVARWLWACTPPLKKSEISKLLNISERSLTRQLAAEDTTYNQLFAEVQAERAQNLLANQKLTISQVAYRMGYSDPAAFTRAFSQWREMTPSEWRASHR